MNDNIQMDKKNGNSKSLEVHSNVYPHSEKRRVAMSPSSSSFTFGSQTPMKNSRNEKNSILTALFPFSDLNDKDLKSSKNSPIDSSPHHAKSLSDSDIFGALESKNFKNSSMNEDKGTVNHRKISR
jgi:hypothetical protein